MEAVRKIKLPDPVDQETRNQQGISAAVYNICIFPFFGVVLIDSIDRAYKP